MVIRCMVLMDINRELRPIINHIALGSRQLLLGRVRVPCGTASSEERGRAAELSVICGRLVPLEWTGCHREA